MKVKFKQSLYIGAEINQSFSVNDEFDIPEVIAKDLIANGCADEVKKPSEKPAKQTAKKAGE